jgi:hypothetical protein
MKVLNKTFFFMVSIFFVQAHAKNVVLGNVYEIKEKDAQVELMEKINKTNWDDEIKKRNDPDLWLATKAVNLPLARETTLRAYVPFYKSEFEIKDSKGNTIYPKGYTFNPLRFIKMPNKLYILSPKTTKYFIGKIRNTDQIIIANGNPLKERKKLKSPVFMLDEKTKNRLGIKKVPSIIWQEGAMLKIKEISIKDLENEINY